jgi:RNA polymerase sigma factor (sigma-70 family)
MPARRDKPKLTITSEDAAEEARRDDRLIAGLLAGDAAALRRIISHYDRLVRYAVFCGCKDECRRDPALLDSIASEVWTGFVASIRRRGKGPDGTLKAYLAQIARNKTTDHLRRIGASPNAASVAQNESEQTPDPAAGPLDALIDFENIEVLRSCFAELPAKDRKLLKEIELLTSSKWSEAAARLNLPESTIRSRWNSVVERLRRCVANKTTNK